MVTLDDLCEYLKNWFEIPGCEQRGTIQIENGEPVTNCLKQWQYYHVVGSVFNDGVHQFGEYTCSVDETFDGAVVAMAVPPSVIALLSRINEWEEKYGNFVKKPYSSESFAGYSYTKASGSGSDGAGGWQTVFAKELSRWRKI